jgi:sensor histidine kinase YesM
MMLSDTSEVIRRALPSKFGRILLFLVGWTLVATLSAVHWWFFPAGDYPYTWWHLWLVKLLVWLSWGCVTLGILVLAQRFRLTKPLRLSRLLILVVSSFVVTGMYLLVYVLLLHLGINRPVRLDTFKNLSLFVMKAHSTFYYLAFWVVVAIEHAAGFYRRLHDRELQQEQLQTELARSQLSALQSQLQPHFLFNTLNTVSSMIMSGDREEANDMVVKLSDVLRLNLERTDRQFVPLSQELEFAHLFLDLMRARFSDRLSIDIAVADGVSAALVPSMILQPLIENAVKYSTSAVGEVAVVKLQADRDDTNLVITIMNSCAVDSKPQGSGLGLHITRNRLEKLYGRTFELALEHLTETSVQLRLVIPFTSDTLQPELGQ